MVRLGISRHVALTLAVGAIGAFAGRHFQMPGGAFTGALAAVAVVRLLNGPADELPKWLRSSARIVLGLTIGASVTPATLQTVARALLPVAIAILALIAFGFIAAWALRRWTRMTLPTALCGSAPGMLAGMVALADDLGGDARVVASMHLVRLVSVMVLVPPLVHVLFPGVHAAPPPISAANALSQAPAWQLACLLVLGQVVGLLAMRFNVPAGEILGSMIVAAVLNPTWLHVARMPLTWKLYAQWIVGAGVGATMSRAALRDFRPFVAAGGLTTAFLIASGMFSGWVLSQATSLDPITCMIGAAPGGTDNMIILADEMGGDIQLVTAMHISRMAIVMLLLPVLSRYALKKRMVRPRGSQVGVG